jgi:hypothetical protein
MPVQASYVCTGVAGPADNTTPYFNGDLTDPNCDIDNVEAALGITIDESLIVGSKTDTVGDPITSWVPDETGLGTLEILAGYTDTSGTWQLTGSVQPLFFVDKYDSAYDIYTYMGGSTSPFSDSWDPSNRGTVGATCAQVNCGATTSHISVYSTVPVPAAVWLLGSGLIGLVGIGRRRS